MKIEVITNDDSHEDNHECKESTEIVEKPTECKDAVIIANKLLTGQNVFLTGGAGVGKTYTTRKVLEILQDREVAVLRCATTGVASLQIPSGRTLHSTFKLPIDPIESYAAFARKVGAVISRRGKDDQWLLNIRNARILLVDEVSMCSAHLLEMLDIVTRLARDNSDPMGGLVLFAVGDFLQLQPVYNVKATLKPHPRQKFYCFHSYLWREMEMQPHILTKIYRQENAAFSTILNKIRFGKTITPLEYETLRARVGPPGDMAVRIMVRRADVTRINAEKLAHAATRETPLEYFNFPFRTKGRNDNIIRSLVGDVRYGLYINRDDRYQTYCVGTRVMQIVNSQGYVNGDRGTVVGFAEIPQSDRDLTVMAAISAYNPDTMPLMQRIPRDRDTRWFMPVVKYDRTGECFAMRPYTWQIGGDPDRNIPPDAMVTALAFCLAWASTVHKVQGCTLSGQVHIDCKMMDWIPGSFYVALSRATDLDNVTFSNFTGNYKCNADASSFYRDGCGHDQGLLLCIESEEDLAAAEIIDAINAGVVESMRGADSDDDDGVDGVDDNGDEGGGHYPNNPPPAQNGERGSECGRDEDINDYWGSTVLPVLEEFHERFGDVVQPGKRRPEVFSCIDRWVKKARKA